MQKIALTPEGKSYIAAGTWSVLGLGSMDGAGGQNSTTRRLEFEFSLAA